MHAQYRPTEWVCSQFRILPEIDSSVGSLTSLFLTVEEGEEEGSFFYNQQVTQGGEFRAFVRLELCQKRPIISVSKETYYIPVRVKRDLC